MPTDNRATAERIAPFTLKDAERYVLRMGTTNEQDIVDAVNDDRKHRDRTAERDDITDERMQAAWDEAYRRVKSPNGLKVEWSEHRPVDIAWHREFIAAFHGLAAEFDAGMAHRDRTAEREAAKKAWDAAAERRYGPGWPVHSSSDKARDAYLAAEFDAGERVTLSDGSVVTRSGYIIRREHADEKGADGTNIASWELLIRRTDTGADFDAVKRLAKQRGAER